MPRPMSTKDSQGCGGKSKAIAICKQDLARPLNEGESRKSLERIWAKERSTQ